MEIYINKGISGIIPIYDNNYGNCCKLIFCSGETHIDKRSSKTVFRLMCNYFAINYEAFKKKYGTLINRHCLVPVVLNKNLILVPFKMRKSISLKDGSYGYLNLLDIKEVKKNENYSVITLNNNINVYCIQSFKTTKEHFNQGNLVYNYYLNELSSYNNITYCNENKSNYSSIDNNILQLISILKQLLKQ